MSTTYLAFKTKVEEDLDLQEEQFISDDELLGYTNEGLREAEKEYLTLYEDYLLDNANLALVTGTSKYSLPTGIFANKIRGIIYSSNSIIYEIKRIRSSKKFLERAYIRNENPTDYYSYIILNSSANGIQIELSPPAKETSSTNVTIWFIRKVDEIDADSDVVDKDLPECINFLYAYVKGKCKQKENAGTMPQDAAAEIEQQRKMLVDTLTSMVPDDDNKVEMDLSVYEEMS